MINNDNNNFINSNSRFTYCIDSDDSDEKIVKKTKKRTKSSTRIKSRTKNDNIDYEEEYQKIRKELEKYKNQLVQERIKENMLKRQVGIKSKKEGTVVVLVVSSPVVEIFAVVSAVLPFIVNVPGISVFPSLFNNVSVLLAFLK